MHSTVQLLCGIYGVKHVCVTDTVCKQSDNSGILDDVGLFDILCD